MTPTSVPKTVSVGPTRIISLLLALLAGSALLVGLVWGLALKCDDSCSTLPGWREDPDAWQWNGLAALGMVAFAAGAGLFVSVWRRRPWLGVIAIISGFAAVALLAGALSSEWIEHLDRRSPGELLLLVAGVFAPILAVLLSLAPRPGR